jgi:hypothetical protein
VDSLTAFSIVSHLVSRGIRATAEFWYGRAIVYVKTEEGELAIVNWQDFRSAFPA